MTFQKPIRRTKVNETLAKEEINAIMEEELYVNKLMKIITRDFFPELHRIQEIYNNEGRPEESESEIKLKLDEFLDNYNSEDNHSFGQILEKQKENWKQKFWWMFKNNEIELLGLPNSEGSKTKMLEADQIKRFMITNGDENETSLLFFPESKKNVKSYSEPNDNHSDRINYENTRFPSSLNANILIKTNQNMIPSNSNSPLNNKFGCDLGFKTPDLLGYKRKEENQKILLQEITEKNTISDTSSFTKKLSFKSEVNGYDLLKLPSPSPNDFKSPLMTWGEIEDTPLKLDQQKYILPDTPERDILKNRLANSFTAKRKISKKIQAKRMQNLLSNTPKRLTSDLSSKSIVTSKRAPLNFVSFNSKK